MNMGFCGGQSEIFIYFFPFSFSSGGLEIKPEVSCLS